MIAMLTSSGLYSLRCGIGMHGFQPVLLSMHSRCKLAYYYDCLAHEHDDDDGTDRDSPAGLDWLRQGLWAEVRSEQRDVPTRRVCTLKSR